MPHIGPLELVLVMIIVLIVFGPRRLPEIGRSLGTGIRRFKEGIGGDQPDAGDQVRLEHEAERRD